MCVRIRNLLALLTFSSEEVYQDLQLISHRIKLAFKSADQLDQVVELPPSSHDSRVDQHDPTMRWDLNNS